MAAVVDRLISINAWRWTGALTRVNLPPLRAGCMSYTSKRVVSEGEDLFVRCTFLDGMDPVCRLWAWCVVCVCA